MITPKRIFLFATFIVLGWAIMIAGFALAQRSLIYHPDRTRPLPALYGASDMAIVRARTEDGLTLTGWFAPPGEEANRPIVVIFHGNAGNIGSRVRLARPLIDRGYGVVLAEYRGFGGNKGKPSEQGLYRDGKAWMKWIEDKGYNRSQIVVYGESLGTGVATEMARRFPEIRALVLQSGFTSMTDMGLHYYPFLPVRLLLVDHYDNIDRIGVLRAPVLILHGARDSLVPVAHGHRLHEGAKAHKKLVIFDEAAHSDLDTRRIAAEIAAFVDSMPPAPSSKAAPASKP